MAKISGANRYAKAIFEIAQERKTLDAWQSDLEKISNAFADTELKEVLDNPGIPFEQKTQLLKNVFKDVNPLALNLASLLVSKRIISLSDPIVEDYKKLVQSLRGIEQAEITSAVPLSDEDKQKLSTWLGGIIGKKVIVKTSVDKSLIGGIIARVEGKVLDGSTRGKLMALKKELSGGG
jgi:F-type H+-transporting ATPase subunit delta